MIMKIAIVMGRVIRKYVDNFVLNTAKKNILSADVLSYTNILQHKIIVKGEHLYLS